VSTDRLEQQMRFILEMDRLKGVLRQTATLGGVRQENSCEHSWHIAVMAPLLAEYANEKVDVARVVKMLLIHDVVEIDAGDTFCYDEVANRDKAEREQRAADRLFGLLPSDQSKELREIWEEFEAFETPEAKFANSLDRLQAMMLNHYSDGASWRKHGISSARVLQRNEAIGRGSRRLWEYARDLVHDAVKKGFVKE
jgi:putative hydrolases of HD superfamily